MTWPVALGVLCGGLLAVPAVRYGGRLTDGENVPVSAFLVVGGVVGGGFGFALGWDWLLLPFFGLVGLLLTLAVVDLDTFRLPKKILIPGGVVFVVASALILVLEGDAGSLADAAVGAGVYFLVMLLLFALSRGALGFGDVRLAVVLGWATGLFGWRVTVTAVVLGSLMGGLVAVVALIRGASRKSSIPYGPPMMLGAWLAILLTAV